MKYENKSSRWGHGTSKGIEKIECGNSRGQLKKKWNFQGWSRKNHMEFPWVLVFCLENSNGCNTILWNFQGWSFILSGISKGKVANPKLPVGFFKKVYPQHRCLNFFWNSPFYTYRICVKQTKFTFDTACQFFKCIISN